MMKSPSYEITDFGIFDSSVVFPRQKKTEPRAVKLYEIDICTADMPGVTIVNGQEYPLVSGTVICGKPGAVRQTVLPFKCLYLHLRTKDEGLKDFFASLPDVAVLSDVSEPVRIFHEMMGISALSAPESSFLLQSLVARLFACLAPLVRNWGEKGATSAYIHQKALLEVEQMIRDNPAEDLSLKVLASRANLSPVYFHRIFTDYFGKTPGRFVLDCRIAAAKFKLVTEEGSMAEIAAACGFSSQAYFNCKFKDAVGMTPLQYRKTMLSRAQI